MSRLLSVGIRRYVRSIIFWLGIVATIIIAVLNGLDAKRYYLDDWCIVLQYFVNTVVVTWMVGREGSEGIFRNKIIVGHTKASIYMSEFILANIASIIMFLIHAIIFGVCNSYAHIAMDVNMMVKMFLIFMLVNIAICSLIVMFSCLASRFVIVAVFNVLFVLGIYYCAYSLEGIVYEEPYVYEAEYETEITENKFGEEIVLIHEIEGTGKYVPNPYYIGGWQQILAETIYNLVPTCQMNSYVDFLDGYFGYDTFRENHHGMTYEYNFSERRSFTDNENKEANIDIICSILVIIVTTVGGLLVFKKKRFK